MKELLRPWKLASFAVGMALLLYGALAYRLVDWDVGVSVLMGAYAYLTAGWAVRALWKGTLAVRALGALSAWFGADGTYSLYWLLVDSTHLEAMRSANFAASLPLYLLCGMLWAYQGSLLEIWNGRPRLFRP